MSKLTIFDHFLSVRNLCLNLFFKLKLELKLFLLNWAPVPNDPNDLVTGENVPKPSWPPGCYLYDGRTVYFNHDVDSNRACDDEARTCICKEEGKRMLFDYIELQTNNISHISTCLEAQTACTDCKIVL